MGAGALMAGLAFAAFAPGGDFTFAPQVPVVGQPVTFTAAPTNPGRGPLGLAWDLDGDGQAREGAGTVVRWTYATPGTRRVRVDITDAEGVTGSVTRPVAVDAPPTAAIAWTPAAPTVDDVVALRAGEADPDGRVAGVAWDTDGDGAFDDPPTPRFARPGAYPVAVQVTDDRGVSTVARATVDVVNRPPSAAFEFRPGVLRRGQRVVLRSTSSDPDRGGLTEAWDLDGDGAFDERSGPRVVVRFGRVGARKVALRVTDEHGATATSFVILTVGPKAAPLLAPFPVVGLSGWVARGRSVQVRRLAVERAPVGARIEVVCRGGGCPFARRRFTVHSARRPVRVRALDGHRLRPGAVVVVRVSAKRRTGKYVAFRFRRGRPPRRTERCLEPGRRAPVRCPED